jgi:putative DNA-invertase from lambdoid prophage Rac
MAAACRREIDVVLVWRLDRWGRSLADLLVTMKEPAQLGVGFVSLTEALDMTTPTARAMAGLLSVFAEFEHEILRERIRPGIAEARLQGKHLGRPVTVGKKTAQIRKLHHAGVSKAEIARGLNTSRTSVRRILATYFPKKQAARLPLRNSTDRPTNLSDSRSLTPKNIGEKDWLV